jgi:hypothetical protein
MYWLLYVKMSKSLAFRWHVAQPAASQISLYMRHREERLRVWNWKVEITVSLLAGR